MSAIICTGRLCGLAPDVFWRQDPRVELSYDPVGIAKGLQLFDGLNIDMLLLISNELLRQSDIYLLVPVKLALLGFVWVVC